MDPAQHWFQRSAEFECGTGFFGFVLVAILSRLEFVVLLGRCVRRGGGEGVEGSAGFCLVINFWKFSWVCHTRQGGRYGETAQRNWQEGFPDERRVAAGGARLAELAREMRELTYGGDGVPEWGTQFTEIESQGMNVGLELARLFMEQSVEQQAERVPDSALAHEGEAADDRVALEDVSGLEQLEALIAASDKPREESSPKKRPLSPKVRERDVVATGRNSDAFGVQLAARAWSLGLFQAKRKAYVADGGSWLWTIWEDRFKPFGFVPILDIIHAVTYLYAAAMAGRSAKEGGPVYRRWIGWVWRGEVAKVIAEIAARQEELGLPTDADGKTSPRQIVHRTLTYLQNQHARMDYPRYRKRGLPITSSLMESTVKQINRRIKGTEKFWRDRGGEAMLQMKADTLSDSDPLTAFWTRRSNRQSGLHRCCDRRPAVAV